MFVDLVARLLASGLTAVAFLALPLAIVSANRHAVRVPPIREFVEIPLLPKLTIGAGLVLGAAAARLAATPDLVHPARIFASPGPWDLTFLEFLRERVNPLAFDYAGAAQLVAAGDLPAGIAAALGAAAGATLAAIAVCLRVWYAREAALAAAMCVVTVACTAYLVFYACAGSLWLLNHLNFLAFMTPLVLVRRYARFFRNIP